MSLTHPDSIEPERVQLIASGVGVVLRSEDVTRLVAFGELFLSWNERINLGGKISGSDLVSRHLVDAFVASRFIPDAARVVDVGSGGGLPALPLAVIRPDLQIDLFEPTGKKVAFLRTAIRALGLKDRVSVHDERVVAEGNRPGAFDLAMSRATLAPREWLALGRTLIAPNGQVMVFATDAPTPDDEQPRHMLRYATDRCLLLYGRGR